MRFFIGSYIYDIILLILCGVVFKTFILKKDYQKRIFFITTYIANSLYTPFCIINREYGLYCFDR